MKPLKGHTERMSPLLASLQMGPTSCRALRQDDPNMGCEDRREVMKPLKGHTSSHGVIPNMRPIVSSNSTSVLPNLQPFLQSDLCFVSCSVMAGSEVLIRSSFYGFFLNGVILCNGIPVFSSLDSLEFILTCCIMFMDWNG
jgi:hypothetical protein